LFMVCSTIRGKAAQAKKRSRHAPTCSRFCP
jgi:hypothetical protein